ncbi:MORN3 [Symbiodinium natans]|uniref:MORN3 protein n=1 Tax=Symbiodinium natans TaxID=878477 RepID=A0A812NBF7_9DINO|nr:MORN3 [Symbiodinium natans]
MSEQQYPKAGHMSPRRIHSAHEARRLEEAGAAHSEHDASVYWHPHYGWVEREPDDFKMVHPARLPERPLPSGCGAYYPPPDSPRLEYQRHTKPHGPKHVWETSEEHAGHPGRSQARRPGMPQSGKGMKGPPPKHLSNGSQMLLESETLPSQLSPGADDSTTFHETPQHLAPSLVSSPLSEHLQSHASTAPGHFPFAHEYEGHRAAMPEQYPKAGHMSPRRIHSAHEARRLEEAGAAHSEHDASVYWHPHYGWVEREPDDFKMVHPARFPERPLPTGCGARYPAHHAPDVPHYFAEQSSQPHRPLGQHSQFAAPGSDGHQRQFVSGQELDESSRAQLWEARAAPQQHMAPPPHMSGASRLQQQMLLLQQEQEMLLSLSNSRHMPSHAQEYIAPSDAKAVPSRLQSQHSTEDPARKGVQKSPRQERSIPPTQTSYPLAQHFLQQHGLNDQQEDPFARQTVQSTFKSGKTQTQAKQLSPSHSPVHSALQSQQDELLYSASTGQGMQGSPSLRTLAASTSAPAYPRARELEHQRRLLQERHDELRAHPQGNLSCTPRTQHRKGGGLVQNAAKAMSRSSSAKAITAKGNNSRFPDSGPPRSPSVPRSPGTNRPAHTAVIKDLGKTAVFVEPITAGRRTPRSQTVQTVHPKPGHKEARPRAVERSGSPFAGHRASPVRSDRSAPAAAVRPARAAQPARPARPDGTKPVSPSRGSSHSSPRSPRSPRSERSPQGLASNPRVNRQVQPKAKPTKIKASDESLRGSGAAAPAERLLCGLAQRTQQLQQRPLGDPSPERLPRKPAVPLAPRSPRSQTPPKKSPAGHAGPAGLAGLASYLPGGPAEPSKPSADFADKVAALPLQPDKTKKSEESQGGRVYMGFRDGKGQKSGYGVMQADGTTYTGQWCGSKREGYGTLFFKGGVFEGQWLQGNAHGRGAIHFQNGDTFEGTYAHNKKCGHGVYTWADGTNEAGEYLGGQKDGIHLWRSGSESWEVVYEKGTVVATRRVDTADAADTVDRSDTVTTAKEDVTDLRPHRSSDVPSVSAAPTAAEARTASTARAGSEKETPRALDKARPAPRPTPPPSPPCPSAKAGQLGSLPSNRCRSDSAFRAQGFTDQEIALIERRSPPSSPAAAPDRAAQPGGCSVRVYFPTSARSRTRDTSRGPCGAAPRVSAPEAATADAAAGAAAPAWPQAAAAPSEDSSAQRVQEMDNDSDEAPTRLRETTPERPERPEDVSPFEVATFSEKGSCD